LRRRHTIIPPTAFATILGAAVNRRIEHIDNTRGACEGAVRPGLGGTMSWRKSEKLMDMIAHYANFVSSSQELDGMISADLDECSLQPVSR
jgi:hypothetical protein